MADARGPEPPDGPEDFGENPEHAGDDWSSVVFDDGFVRAATIHEPTAAERRLAALPPTPLTPPRPTDFGEDPYRLHDPLPDDGVRAGAPDDVRGFEHGDFGRPIGRTTWWRQSVAWVLAVLMGVGVVAMAVTAVAPGRSGQNAPSPQPSVGTVAPRPPGATEGPAAEPPGDPQVPDLRHPDGVTNPVAGTGPAVPAVMLCPAPPRAGC
ncbi:hypothetical protein LO772_23250 [Yinghuangia sp. ASG 101]|uniref:SCO2584 family spore wall biosynthesis protein n=1 Tax=Yinghuangia sp. ASG 101 TaxID=2896848 RepID=UPI001E4ABEEE|nr:hypothetical protein [Yinghuangia sp. ASG 101]UGQ09809.1 hypothetical protein LO772_23250 [Yinghuangia sp. ASG 101]